MIDIQVEEKLGRAKLILAYDGKDKCRSYCTNQGIDPEKVVGWT